jgi:hypothetical protein
VGAKEDGRGFFTAKGEKGPRFEGPGRWGICRFLCGLCAAWSFWMKRNAEGSEDAEEDAEKEKKGLVSA